MTQKPIDQLFTNTTMGLDGPLAYVTDNPVWRMTIKRMGYGPYLCEMAGWADCVECHLRSYVGGLTKRIHRVFAAIRAFMVRDKFAARKGVAFVLKWMKETILLNEWYELMPNYEKACHQIKRSFPGIL